MGDSRSIAFADLAAVLPTVVLIDGLAASGKSTFAREVATARPSPAIVCMDDFCSYDASGQWTPPDVARVREEVVSPWLKGADVHYHPYDWARRRRAADARAIVNAGALVVEGVYSARLHRPPETFLIWVTCDRETRWERAMQRDGLDAAPLWRHWSAAEDAYAEREDPVARADLVVDGASGATPPGTFYLGPA